MHQKLHENKTLNKFKENWNYGCKTGNEWVQKIDERVQQDLVLETDRYKYLGIVVNTERYLKDHIKQMGAKIKENSMRDKYNRNKGSGWTRSN